MTKNHNHLLKLASKFYYKYAQYQSLQDIIQNAASYGEQNQSGIMNFPAQLKQDQADLWIVLSISPVMMGGLDIKVEPPTVDPPQFASKYSQLPNQIKNYLDKHIKDFPQIPQGTTTLKYSGKTASSGIAQR